MSEKSQRRTSAQALNPQPLARKPRASLNTGYMDYTVHEWFEAGFVFGLLFLTCWMLASFLLPMAMAAIFSILLWPLRQRLTRRGWSPGWASALISFIFAMTFLIPFVTIALASVRSIVRQVQESDKISQVNSIADLAQALGLNDIYHDIGQWLSVIPLPKDQVRSYFFKALQAVMAQVIDFMHKIASDLPQLFVGNLIILVSLFVLLSEGDRIISKLHHLSPLDEKLNLKAFAYLSQLCQAVIWAALAAGGVQAAIITVCSAIADIGDPLTLGFLVFVFSFVPIVGAAPLTFSIVIYSVLKTKWTAAIILLIGAVLASVADNFVRPLVMRGGSELHPLIGFISAIGGLQLFGFYGIFIGPILAGLSFYLIELRWEDSNGR